MSNIIVFGASGQLGQCLQLIAEENSMRNVIFLPEEEANILDNGVLEKVFNQYKPAYCINCAAYTAVDKAEDDVDLARKVNSDGAANLARFSRQFDTTLIHVSTDFVFEGNSPLPLSEENPANPINIYGLTKLEGEKAVSDTLNKFFVIRTSWLYSEYGNNFVKTMLRLGTERDELKIIADQIGTPTYAIDLARFIFKIIGLESDQYGIYHFSNEGVCSWYDFAKAIFDLGNISVKALPVRTSEYITRAVRPVFSVMDKSKVKKTFDLEIPYWRESLEICIGNLKNSTH